VPYDRFADRVIFQIAIWHGAGRVIAFGGGAPRLIGNGAGQNYLNAGRRRPSFHKRAASLQHRPPHAAADTRAPRGCVEGYVGSDLQWWGGAGLEGDVAPTR